MTDLVLYNSHAGVAEIVFNRPQKRNAITLEMYQKATSFLKTAQADEQVKAVLFYGEGDSFCAGNDIQDFVSSIGDSDGLQYVIGFLHELAGFEKPVLAAVHGDAVGIGTTMMLHCDMVIAADDLKCQMPFVRLGLIPEAGSTLLVPNMLGHRRAFELLIDGAPFNADQANNYGFVNTVVSKNELVNAARKKAASIASLPQNSVKQSKRLLKKDYLEQLHRVIDEEGSRFYESMFSEEARAAFMAFLQKS